MPGRARLPLSGPSARASGAVAIATTLANGSAYLALLAVARLASLAEFGDFVTLQGLIKREEVVDGPPSAHEIDVVTFLKDGLAIRKDESLMAQDRDDPGRSSGRGALSHDGASEAHGGSPRRERRVAVCSGHPF